MSFAAECGWTLLRSLVIAAAALPLCVLLSRLLANTHRVARPIGWGLLLLPFLTPELVVGYAYANFSLALIRHPLLNELFYGLLVLLKYVPVGTMLLIFSPPPPVGAEAMMCLGLSRRRAFAGGLWRSTVIRTGGPIRTWVAVMAVVGLLTFQEFEMASLFRVTSGRALSPVSWTNALFEARALQRLGDRDPFDLMRRAALPLSCAAAWLAPLLLFVAAGRRRVPLEVARETAGSALRGLGTTTAWVYLAAAVSLVTLVPSAIVGGDTPAGIEWLLASELRTAEFFRQLGTGLALAAIAAVAAAGLAGVLLWPRRSRLATLATFAAAIPGLLGSLTLGLLIIFIVLQPGLAGLYNTELPLVLGLALFLLPRALVLVLLVSATRPREPQFAARLLLDAPSALQRSRGQRLLWSMRTRGIGVCLALLCWWGFMDLTLNYLLAPVGLQTAVARVYHEMHFGRRGFTSAIAALTVVAPLVAFAILFLTARLAWLIPLPRRTARPGGGSD